MNVFIARDGVEIGEYPREELEALAAQHVIEPSDMYWHDGMQGWRPLDELLAAEVWESSPQPNELPPAAPSSTRRIRTLFGAAFAAFAVVAVIVLFWIVRSGEPHIAGRPVIANTSDASRTDLALRTRAMDTLMAKINTLPSKPSPSSNTYYSRFSLDVPRPPAPFTARLQGHEEVIDPQTQKLVADTEFTLRADYADGGWTFKDYVATKHNVVDDTNETIVADSTIGLPPSIVSVLGLRVPQH